MTDPSTPSDGVDTAPPPAPVEVALSRGDFMYFNWVLAFERPVLPFFVYTFTLLALASLVGLWPAARLYALAALVPLLGQALFVHFSARRLWRQIPDIGAARRYQFKERSYLVSEAAKNSPVPFDQVRLGLESRRGFYLMREGGRADILPRRSLEDDEAVKAFLQEKVGAWKRSSFL